MNRSHRKPWAQIGAKYSSAFHFHSHLKIPISTSHRSVLKTWGPNTLLRDFLNSCFSHTFRFSVSTQYNAARQSSWRTSPVFYPLPMRRKYSCNGHIASAKFFRLIFGLSECIYTSPTNHWGRTSRYSFQNNCSSELCTTLWRTIPSTALKILVSIACNTVCFCSPKSSLLFSWARLNFPRQRHNQASLCFKTLHCIWSLLYSHLLVQKFMISEH